MISDKEGHQYCTPKIGKEVFLFYAPSDKSFIRANKIPPNFGRRSTFDNQGLYLIQKDSIVTTPRKFIRKAAEATMNFRNDDSPLFMSKRISQSAENPKFGTFTKQYHLLKEQAPASESKMKSI